ncbi:Rossmann-fold NAD(P)-binding domain-containing protein [Algihabitans albus]|uniref:hypothetical protein n=1 Tax=Algihabitans albus TaxID=2164067 RepID=UPI0013C3714B|nr:hypothetical protein [Algihabitans albus]
MNVEHATLRPTIFMQHFLIVPGLYERGDDAFYLPSRDAKLAMIDCRDIAFAASDLLLRPASKLPTEPVYLTGPKLLSGEDMRARLSWASGRPLKWIKDREAFADHSRATGSPLEIGGVYEAAATGAFAEVRTDRFEALFQRRPTSFAKFALDHTAHFKAH